jgi:hypothetical protein
MLQQLSWCCCAAGDAVAVAVSTGGLASSTSLAQKNASVLTTTTAAQGGTAVAAQSADQGSHSIFHVALADNTATHEQHDPPMDGNNNAANSSKVTWEDAPACPFPPTAGNTHKDDSNRLWSWHAGKSCAFKAAVYDLWDTAPACPSSTTIGSTVLDKSGRRWGWHDGASCAVKVSVGCARICTYNCCLVSQWDFH